MHQHSSPIPRAGYPVATKDVPMETLYQGTPHAFYRPKGREPRPNKRKRLRAAHRRYVKAGGELSFKAWLREKGMSGHGSR